VRSRRPRTKFATNVFPMNFSFKWRHLDGSTVEFGPEGWKSDDPEKTGWLARMKEISSSVPAIPPNVLLWLQQECELISFSGPNLTD
jgi:hypothetical protein